MLGEGEGGGGEGSRFGAGEMGEELLDDGLEVVLISLCSCSVDP